MQQNIERDDGEDNVKQRYEKEMLDIAKTHNNNQ
jgi:hypothetical protein